MSNEMYINEEPLEFDTQPRLEIDEDTAEVMFDTLENEHAKLEGFRLIPDSDMREAQLLLSDSKGNIQSELVLVPSKIEASKKVVFNIIKKHKRKIEVVGAFTLIVGVGIVRRKLKGGKLD